MVAVLTLALAVCQNVEVKSITIIIGEEDTKHIIMLMIRQLFCQILIQDALLLSSLTFSSNCPVLQ